MTIEELIASGKLELYVLGALTEAEAQEVEQALADSSAATEEVVAIETALMVLGEAAAPKLESATQQAIMKRIQKVRSIHQPKRKTNWAAITGWAAAAACAAGILWMVQQNDTLKEDIEITTTENKLLKQQLETNETQLAETNSLLELLRSKEYNTIVLPGNADVAPDAFAKVYYNPDENIAYIDTKGLPEAAEGKVYQAWSLTLSPLTPSSMGVMDAATEVEQGIYRFENVPSPEAFGITLEPAGGSESPSLDQLYTLGTVAP